MMVGFPHHHLNILDEIENLFIKNGDLAGQYQGVLFSAVEYDYNMSPEDKLHSKHSLLKHLLITYCNVQNVPNFHTSNILSSFHHIYNDDVEFLVLLVNKSEIISKYKCIAGVQ